MRVQLTSRCSSPGRPMKARRPTGERERDAAALYDLAARECEVMEDHRERLPARKLSVNLNRQGRAAQHGYIVRGSMAYQITLK